MQTSRSGTASMGLGIPNVTALVGAEIAFQWVVLDPQGAYRNAVALSDGLFVLVGR